MLYDLGVSFLIHMFLYYLREIRDGGRHAAQDVHQPEARRHNHHAIARAHRVDNAIGDAV